MERVKYAVNARDGVQIAYGLVGDGAPLLLLHGSMVSAAVWHAFGSVEALRDEFDALGARIVSLEAAADEYRRQM